MNIFQRLAPNLLSQDVVSVAPAFCVIETTLEGSLVESKILTKHYGHLQHPRSPLLGDIDDSFRTLEDRVFED